MDNVAITAGSGTSIATDDVGTVHYQKVKLDAGGDGVSVPVVAGQQTMAASIPVVVASNQTGIPVTNAGITTLAGAVAGTEMQVDVLTSALPSGAATAALQGGGLPAALGAGGGLKVDGSGTALPVSGTFFQATQPVSLAAGTITVPTAIVHGQKTVSSTGTEEALGGSTTLYSGVRIKALHANTGWVYVGANPVTSSTGFVLDAGEEVFLEVANLATVYIDVSVNGEGVSYIGA